MGLLDDAFSRFDPGGGGGGGSLGGGKGGKYIPPWSESPLAKLGAGEGASNLSSIQAKAADLPNFNRVMGGYQQAKQRLSQIQQILFKVGDGQITPQLVQSHPLGAEYLEYTDILESFGRLLDIAFSNQALGN